MRKFLSAAVLAGVGLVAATIGRPAEAGAYVSVGVGVPGIVVAPPVVAYAPPYVYAGPRVVYPGYVRYGYGRGFRGGYGYGRAWRGGWHR